MDFLGDFFLIFFGFFGDFFENPNWDSRPKLMVFLKNAENSTRKSNYFGGKTASLHPPEFAAVLSYPYRTPTVPLPYPYCTPTVPLPYPHCTPTVPVPLLYPYLHILYPYYPYHPQAPQLCLLLYLLTSTTFSFNV